MRGNAPSSSNARLLMRGNAAKRVRAASNVQSCLFKRGAYPAFHSAQITKPGLQTHIRARLPFFTSGGSPPVIRDKQKGNRIYLF